MEKIHIFVMVQGRENEPDNLIQSVSMEIERLHTLDDGGQKSANYGAVWAERGLTGTMGTSVKGCCYRKMVTGMVKNLTISRKYSNQQFCMNCIRDMYCS